MNGTQADDLHDFLDNLGPDDPMKTGISKKSKFNIEERYLPMDFQQQIAFKPDKVTLDFQKMTQRRNWFKGYVLTKALMVIHNLLSGLWYLSETEHNKINSALILLREVYKEHQEQHYKLKDLLRKNMNN